MDTRKVTLIATIAAIALVAVGIGYAYTAATQNTGNTATSEYLTIIQGDIENKGAYTFANNAKVYWNSTDQFVGGPQTTFTLSGTSGTISGYSTVKIGDSFKLLVAPGNSTYYPTLPCTVEGTNLLLPSIGATADKEAVLFLVVETKNSAETPVAQTTVFKLTANNTFNKEGETPGTWDGGNEFTVYKNNAGTAYQDITVSMYYGYSGTEASGIVVTHAKGGQPEGPSDAPLNNSGLTFTVTKTTA